MKKIIKILLILIAIISFTTLFNYADNKEKNFMIYGEQKENAIRILLPDELNTKNHQEVIDSITSTLNKYDADLFLTRTSDLNGKILNKKYVYLHNDDYFGNFKGDKKLSFSSLDNNNFLATYKTGEVNQIGKIEDFAGNDLLEIHNIKELFNKDESLSGFYIIKLENMNMKDNILKDLSSSLDTNINEIDNVVFNSNYDIVTIILIFILFIVVIILLSYDILNSYKKIGVQKLFGTSNKSIWISYMIPICIQIGLIFVIVSCVMIPIFFKEINILFFEFLIKLCILDIILVSISFLVLSIPFIILKLFTVTSILKNNRPTKEILIVNSIVKIIVSVISIILFVNLLSNLDSVNDFYKKSYSSWEQTKNYVIIPNVSNMPEEIEQTDKLITLNRDMYFTFNKNGSILANFKQFSQTYLAGKPNDLDSIHYAELNPNYLNNNKVYDINNNIINIDETDENFILLIPEKYKSDESNIVTFMNQVKIGQGLGDTQKAKIIWTKNDQELFSYNLSVNPNEGNMVADPICIVTTEHNSNERAYFVVAGFSSSGYPFKIKVSDATNINTEIRPALEQLGINKYLPEITSVYDLVITQTNSLKLIVKILLGTLSSIIILLLFITVQDVINYYEQNKFKITIKKLHGFTLVDKYLDFYKTQIKLFVIILVISIIFSAENLKAIPEIIFISLILLLLESLVSLIAFRKVEQKGIIEITKGGK